MLSWYKKAAEKGLADAQYSLGYMYDYGDEVPQDYKQASSGIQKRQKKVIILLKRTGTRC
jgi:hypothetical protein